LDGEKRATCRGLCGIRESYDSDVRIHQVEERETKAGTPCLADSACTPESVVNVVRSVILPWLSQVEEIEIYSRIVVNGNPYCAHPCYGRMFRRKQDWAFVDMGEDGIVPNHLLCIIDIPKKPL
jgi:hypothetical protein